MNAGKKKFIQFVRHPLKFRAFLFFKLPSAFISGVRVKHIDESQAVVTVPYKWFSQNPFRSTYFACLAMAAEMSTGLLCMLHTYKNIPAISMLVTGIEGRYFKKATDITAFTCNDSDAIRNTIQDAIGSGEGSFVTVKTVGKNKEGELVAEFFITWSFKVRRRT